MSNKKSLQLFTLYQFLSIRVRMSWNLEENKNLFLKLKSRIGLYLFVPTKRKIVPKKTEPTLVEMQQLPDIEKTVSKDEIFCLKWTIYNGRRKVCVNYETDTDKMNFVVYR